MKKITVFLTAITIAITINLQPFDLKAEALQSKIERTRALMNSQETQSVANGEGDLKASAMSMIRGTGMLIGILLVGLYVVKKISRSGAAGQQPRNRVIERIGLGPKSFLAVVEVDGKKMLCGVGVDSLMPLTENIAPTKKETTSPIVYLTQPANQQTGGAR